MRLPTVITPWFAEVFRWIERRPKTTLVAVGVVTAALATGIPRLELRMDGRALVPPDSPAVTFDREVHKKFGVRDELVVLLESRYPEGIYQPDFLRRLIDATAAVRGLPGVPDDQIVSLATERRDRVYPNTLRFRPFLNPFPDTPLLLQRLREDVAAGGALLDGTLVSHQGTAASIFVGVPDVDEIGDRGEFYREVVRRVAPFAGEKVSISVVGAPAAEALLGQHILDDMALILPLSMICLGVVFFLRVWSLWGVSLGLVEVAACLLATFGTMGWLGVPITLTGGILPLVLVSVSLADEVHVFTHYQNLLARHGSERPAVVVGWAFRDMLPPILVTSLTTAFGFLSFVASPIAPIRHFGIFAAFGIIYGLFFSLTAIPAALLLRPPRQLERRRWTRMGAEDRLLVPFLAAARRPRTALALTLLGALALSVGLKGLSVQDSWIEGFAPGSAFRRDTDRVNTHLLGTHRLLLRLAVSGQGAPPEGDGRAGWLLDPDLLNEIGRFESHLRSRPEVGGVLGPYSHVSTISYLWHARKPGTLAIPNDPVKVARVYRFFDLVRGTARRRQVVSDELDQALIAVFLKSANYRETERLLADIAAWKGFEKYSVTIQPAGDVAISQAMIPAIVESQVSSLLWSLVAAFFTLWVLIRSLPMAFMAALPAALSVAAVFGVMGWIGTPLGVATSMFCAIALGVGVDYATHFVAAQERARAEGQDTLAALRDAGPPILTDMAVVALSFGWMGLSQVPSNARLGGLVALALALACVFTLTCLPAAAGSWKAPPAQEP